MLEMSQNHGLAMKWLVRKEAKLVLMKTLCQIILQ